VLSCSTFLYTSLVMKLYRSKHVEGTSVIKDYLLMLVQFIGPSVVQTVSCSLVSCVTRKYTLWVKNIYILNVRPGGTHNYRWLTCYGKYCCTSGPCGTAEHFGFLLTLSDTGFAAYKKFHVFSRWFAVGLTTICNGFRVLRHSERRNYLNALGMSTFSGSKEYQRRSYS
jgi:hypothetical protein